MKLTLHSYEYDVPAKKSYDAGVDYQVFESDVGPDEAVSYIDRLTYPRDSFYLEMPNCHLDFWKHEQSIWVEVAGADLWAISEVSRDEAKAIIEMLHRGERLGGAIPATCREWDAYALLGEGEPAHDAAI